MSSCRLIALWGMMALTFFVFSGFIVEWGEILGLKQHGMLSDDVTRDHNKTHYNVRGRSTGVLLNTPNNNYTQAKNETAITQQGELEEEHLQAATQEKERLVGEASLEISTKSSTNATKNEAASISANKATNVSINEPSNATTNATESSKSASLWDSTGSTETSVLGKSSISVESNSTAIPESMVESKNDSDNHTETAKTETQTETAATTTTTTQALFSSQELLEKRSKGLELTDKFDPEFTFKDYNKVEPKRPSHKWLKSCAYQIAKRQDIVRPFPTAQAGYALGDCIKLCGKCGAGSKNFAEVYYSYACDKRPQDQWLLQNYTVVQQVFQRFELDPKYMNNLPKPAPDMAVFHLRLGDVIERTNIPARDYLIRGGPAHHFQSQKGSKGGKRHTVRSFDEYYETILPYNLSQVDLVGGSHFPKYYRNSRVYSHCLALGLARTGLHVDLKTDEANADKDFYYMSHAKYFMTATGGFSRIISSMVALNGGQEIGRNLDHGPIQYTSRGRRRLQEGGFRQTLCMGFNVCLPTLNEITLSFCASDLPGASYMCEIFKEQFSEIQSFLAFQ